MGRPSKYIYTDELGQIIANHIATKAIGLKHIAELPDVNVEVSTIRAWIADKEHPFSNIYPRAKDHQIELLAEETLDIADDGSNDLMTIVKGDVTYEQENKEVTSRSKLRVETRKWLLAKLNPKKYGDKIDITSKDEAIFPTDNLSADDLNTLLALQAKSKE